MHHNPCSKKIPAARVLQLCNNLRFEEAVMENQDFEMPSPKRQKTNSPPPAHATPLQATATATVDTNHGAAKQTESAAAPATKGTTVPSSAVETQKIETQEKDMLDVLMQHVESEAASKDAQSLGFVVEQEQQEQPPTIPAATVVQPDEDMTKDTEMDDVEPAVIIAQSAEPIPAHPEHTQVTAPTEVLQEAQTATADQDTIPTKRDLPPGLEPTDPNTIEQLRAVAETNDLPITSDTLVSDQIPAATEAVQLTDDTAGEPAEPREWETDSSPYESSSSDDTSDSDSSDDDEDDDEEYTLLNPYEQARILMAGEGGDGGDDSDDEGRRSSNRPNAGLRTVNEKPEEILPKPNITITESMPIEELGSVQAIVENTVLITAKTSGEYRVLESNSLLCTAARIPIGVVAETLGRVEAPLYTVRFASEAEIKESGINEKGTKIYYAPSHSTFVFTQPLKAVKGSDASNFHDEEVGDDEMEFSDDEAEAEHKRQMKLKKKGIDPASVPPPSRGGRGGRGQRSRGGRGGGGGGNMHAIPESDTASAYGTTSVEMNYDDVEEGETEYTPLRRPDTMAQVNPHGTYTNGAMSPPAPQYNFSPRNNQDSRGGARGGRGRGNPNHNNNSRGRGRGGNYTQNQNHSQPNRSPYNQTPNTNTNTTSYSQNNYSPSSSTSMYANQQQQSQPQFHALPPPPPPPAPYLTPSSGPYNTNTNTTNSNSGNGTPTGLFTVPPSPMTPLPGGQFNFGFNPGQYQGQQQQQNQYQTQNQAQAQMQAQMQSQWAQYHANLNQYQQQQQGGYGNASSNADAIAQVQRTLEELRRAAGNNGYGASGWNAGQQ